MQSRVAVRSGITESTVASVRTIVLDPFAAVVCSRTYLKPHTALRIVLPQAVEDAVQRWPYMSYWAFRISTAAKGKYLTVERHLEPSIQEQRRRLLTCAELSVLELAASYQATNVNVTVVTTSARLKRACAQSGIPVTGVRAFLSMASGQPSKLALESAWRGFTTAQLAAFIKRVGIGGGVFVLTLVLTAFGRSWFEKLRQVPLAAVTACLLAAAAAYWLRSRERLTYAMVEMFLGVLIILSAVSGGVSGDSLLKAAGGIYVIVRGMDNLGKCLPGSWFGLWWWRVFGE
jgi:hypothetical protein